MKKLVLAVVMASALAAPAMANDFSYNSIEAGAGKSGDFDIIGLGANIALNEVFYFTADYVKAEHKDLADVDANQYSFGFGGHHDITSSINFGETDVFYELAYQNVKADVAGTDLKDNGFVGKVGLRSNLNLDNVDATAYIGHSDFKEERDSVIYGVTAQYYLSEEFSVGVDYERNHLAESETVLAKLRYNF